MEYLRTYSQYYRLCTCIAALIIYGFVSSATAGDTLDGRRPNRLIDAASPYLLQHAYNPVDWYPWGPEALEKARRENKLLIISIGYAACHWCHVMERESFEDPAVAALMNKHFIAIKVDREERPDIDQIYMNACQLLTGRGGWPLNAIALPDGRPVFAGTYFPKENWIRLLNQIRNYVLEEPEEAEKQAQALTSGIRTSEVVRFNTEQPEFARTTLDDIFIRWKTTLDFELGGQSRAPKFPLPIGYRFLLRYHFLSGNTTALEAVSVTLDNMARGGIYDQIGGGFARYSTDKRWFVPHFEKMLYDNAQLVSLYSYAFQVTGDSLYCKTVYETIEFVQRELASAQGGFYSSLDADSEGQEGKFYIWTKNELDRILGEDADMICDYFGVTPKGNWEHGNNILTAHTPDPVFADRYSMDLDELRTRLATAKRLLLLEREKRIRPGLDDKILTSWNALMIVGCVDAYRVFGEERFLDMALRNARFLIIHQLSDDGRLNRSYQNGSSSINGFLDDYAFTIQAFIALYQATFDESWLHTAEKLTQYALKHFHDPASRMLFYTSDIDPELIARKLEVSDNVIPSSNSQMARNLYALGEYLYNPEYSETAIRMLNNVAHDLIGGGPYYANWGILYAQFATPAYELAIVGPECIRRRREFDQYYLPHVLFIGAENDGTLPLLAHKSVKDQTTIYVCRNRSCNLPVTETSQALEQLGITPHSAQR